MSASKDGRFFATASVSGPIKIWSADNLNLIYSLDNYFGFVNKLQFSSDSSELSVLFEDQVIRRFSIDENSIVDEIINIAPHDDFFTGATGEPIYINELVDFALFADGKRIALLDSNNLTIADIQSNETIISFPNTDWLAQIAISPNQKYLAAISFYKVFVWDIENEKLVLEMKKDQFTNSLMFSPDNTVLGINAGGRSNMFIDPTNGNLIERATGKHVAFTFDPSGGKVAVYTDKKVIISDMGDNWSKTKLDFPELYVLSGISYSPDGEMIIFQDIELSIIFWDIEKGNVIYSIPQYGPSKLSFSPDGKYFAVGNWEGVSLWAVPIK